MEGELEESQIIEFIMSRAQQYKKSLEMNVINNILLMIS
jgi:hypothetical protein